MTPLEKKYQRDTWDELYRHNQEKREPKMRTAQLKNWTIKDFAWRGRCVQGTIFNQKNFDGYYNVPEGKVIITSTIKSFECTQEGFFVVTKSGSRYELVGPEYKEDC